MVKPVAEAQRREQRIRAFLRSIGSGAMDELWEHDVFERIEVGQQVVELVNEAQRLAAQARAALVVQAGGLLARDADRALEAALQEADGLEQGRFA